LRSAFDQRGKELSDTALRTTYRQNSQSLETFFSIGNTRALDDSRRLLAGVIDHERDVLARRSTIAAQRIRQANLLATIVSIVGMLIVIGAGVLAFRALRDAQRRELEEERSAELEEAVEDRTAELSAANQRLLEEMVTRQAAEARLRQAQKMDAVGQLTGGIAHDFNNMLAVVLGGVDLARRRIADGTGDPSRHLDSAYEGANRAAALTKRLLSFARAEPLLPSATDPDQLIGGMSEMLDRTLGDRIIVRQIARSGGWPIFVDRHQLENAILNLAVNARDAMEEHGGTLTIATARMTIGAGHVTDLAAGDYVRIAVSDTGAGIAPDLIHRIFDPFFTTKTADKGTGLGLSQVFGYVRQSGGTVTVDSSVGTGTTVSIYLPRHAGVIPMAGLSDPADAPSSSPISLRILVVEDDRRVLASTVDALTELGHHPIACLGSDGALELLQADPDIDLVLSDVLMPGLSGPELVAKLAQERPGLRAVFVTGFAGDIEGPEAFGGSAVLRKPFTIGALGRAIDEAMQSAPPSGSVLERRAAA
jgi:signal transduction histidine kinase/ActR/RegA family two-component response regulator